MSGRNVTRGGVHRSRRWTVGVCLMVVGWAVAASSHMQAVAPPQQPSAVRISSTEQQAVLQRYCLT